MKVNYINLGGYLPTEGYLNIQLSHFQLYGIPSIKYNTKSISWDDLTGEVKECERGLESPAIILHYNLSKKIPIDSESISGINMSHFFEHFTPNDGLKILNECYRVLKPKGVLRISCPDLLKYAKAYVNCDRSFFDKQEIRFACLYEGLTTYGERFISKAYDNDMTYGHKWFYDAESATNAVRKAGFSYIEEKCLHDSALPNIEAIEPSYRAPESFYIEAIK